MKLKIKSNAAPAMRAAGIPEHVILSILGHEVETDGKIADNLPGPILWHARLGKGLWFWLPNGTFEQVPDHCPLPQPLESVVNVLGLDYVVPEPVAVEIGKLKRLLGAAWAAEQERSLERDRARALANDVGPLKAELAALRHQAKLDLVEVRRCHQEELDQLNNDLTEAREDLAHAREAIALIEARRRVESELKVTPLCC